MKVPFTEASQLAQGADVRISGVSVGRISRIERDAEGEAEATLELDSGLRADSLRHAGHPAPEDPSRRDLRRADAGLRGGGTGPEGGGIPMAQVSDSVQLDEVFRTFDPRTQEAFRSWMQGQAGALRGRGEDLSAAIAALEPFADEADPAPAGAGHPGAGGDEVRVRRQRGLRRAVGAPGPAPGPDPRSNAVFGTTAARNEELAEAFTIFPTFLRESRTTLTRLEEFAVDTDPVVTALRPAARELGADRRGARGPRAEPRFVLPGAAGDDSGPPGRQQGGPPPARQRPAAAPRPARRLARAGERDPRGRAPVPRASSPGSRTSPRRARASSST